MEPKVKQDVSNPLLLANSPGAELAYIFEVHHIFDYNERLNIADLASKVHLSKKLILQAEKILGLEGDLLPMLTRHEDYYKDFSAKCKIAYATAKKQFSKLKPILPLLRNEYNESSDRFNDILDYFDADCAEDVFAHSEEQAALYRKQNNHEPDSINLYGWLRRGELDFAKMELPVYDEKALQQWIDEKEWAQHITDAAYFKQLPDILSRFGVGLSLVPHLKKTVYGAIRWFDGRPLIQISDRDHDFASCWFTLFHEFGHAILHKDMEVLEGNINESKAKQNSKERAANKFANDYLFNGDALRKAVFDRLRAGTYMTANALALEFNVNPIFTSYWLRRAQYQPAFQMRTPIDFVEAYQ